MYPPKIPAEILAKRCQDDFVKYFGFAGIFFNLNPKIL